LRHNQQLVGKTINVLIENYDDEGNLYVGRSTHFTPEVDGVVLIESKKELKLNDFYMVKITEAKEYDLIGQII